MFRFIKEHSYEIVKLFFTQIGIAVFGLVLSFATNSNPQLWLLSSIFSVCFYCAILYSEAWEIGAKDRPRILNGRLKDSNSKGFIIALFSNSLNMFFVIILTVCLIFSFLGEFFGNIYAIVWTLQRLLSAMYMGLNMYFSPKQILDSRYYIQPDTFFQPLFYLLAIIPPVISCGIGYVMGKNDRKLFTVKK